ncbi:hypothetical protein O9X98_04960 [Agrobacterium salinitolerans]|nr:hypothetical protein [Agrobacterium salinitolerans]
MIVEVPICYYAHGRRAGKKISAAHNFLETIHLEVPVFADHDAPVVVAWNDLPEPQGMRPQGYWGPDEIALEAMAEHVRVSEGKFFRPLRFREMGRPYDGDRVNIRQFVDAISSGLAEGFLKLPKLRQDGKRVPADVHFETVQDTAREAVVRPIREAASRLIVVDGMVYVRCEEPFICVWGASFEGFSARGARAYWNGGVAKVATSMPSPQALSPMELYPVQRFREAMIRTRRINASNGYNKQALEQYNLGQMPRVDTEWYADPDRSLAAECRIQVRSFIHSISSRRDVILPLTDLRKLRLFTELAGALDALPDDGAMQTIENAGTEWLETYGAYRELHDPEEAALRAAVEIAASRPVHMADIGSPALRR